MESHATAQKGDGTNMMFPVWDRSVWSDYSSRPPLKLDSACANPSSELSVKTISCTSLDIISHDKPKVVREFYKCDQCSETTTSKQMLRQHKDSVHNDRKTFRCSVANCVRAFTSANYLKNHIDIEHTDCSEASIPCPKKDCGLFFPNNYRLKRHIRQDHKQEKLYQCQVCSRKFASLEVRNNHMKTKHGGVPLRENIPVNLLDNNYYRFEQNKESENDTVYAASPISSKFGSLNEQTSIDTTCEAQWLTKSSDSNPPLSKQIDRILCDIFSDQYQERLLSPLSSSELAIAIVSLEEANDEDKRKQVKISSNLNSLIFERSSPFKSSYLFNELDKKVYTSHRLPSHNNNPPNNVTYSQNLHTSMAAQNYPQSNTESEGHSTESQRSFFVSSSQHEDFSDISMEGHLKDVFSTAVDKWNVAGHSVTSYDNPIKLLDYTCLDTMFDDFHEIITSDTFNTHHLVNGSSTLSANLHGIPGPKNHLQSLNNMHSKFLDGSQFNSIDHQMSRISAVPSNQIQTLSNYELNRRKMNNPFLISGIRSAPYDSSMPYHSDRNTRDSSYGMDIARRCQRNPLMNGSMFRDEGRIRENYSQGFPYRSNQQIMGTSQMYYSRDKPAVYIQQSERSQYPTGFNGPTSHNNHYQNSIETEYAMESQSNQYQNDFRRRGPPAYQVGLCHQMLPSQHSAAAASLAHGPPPSLPPSSCLHPQTNSSSRARLYAADSAAALPRQRQHLLCQQQPMGLESQGHRSNSNHSAAAAVDNNSGLEFKDSIEERILSASSNVQSTSCNP